MKIWLVLLGLVGAVPDRSPERPTWGYLRSLGVEYSCAGTVSSLPLDNLMVVHAKDLFLNKLKARALPCGTDDQKLESGVFTVVRYYDERITSTVVSVGGFVDSETFTDAANAEDGSKYVWRLCAYTVLGDDMMLVAVPISRMRMISISNSLQQKTSIEFEWDGNTDSWDMSQ